MKTLHLSIITIVIMAISLMTISHFASGFQQGNEQNYPLIDVPKIMSVAENSTDFIQKTDRYDHYLLVKATLRPSPEKTGNAMQEEYDLVYALYRNHNYCYWDNLLEVTLNDSLNVTSIKEYSLSNEPAGYPQPPVSCLMNLELPKMDYNPLLIILAPSPFATVNETFNASSDDIVFSGTVHNLFSKYITLSVFDPRGEQVAMAEPQPEPDGTFSQTFQPFSPLWSMTGNYTVSITSGTHNLVESPFYFKGVGCCMTESHLHYADQGLPPLEQWKSYVPARNTICAKDLQLVIKAEDGSPACVKPQTVFKLVERGWMLISISVQQNIPVLSNSLKISNANFTIDYNITGNGKILDIKQDEQSKALVLSFETTSNGTLTVSVPRALLDITKNVRGEGSFGVLTDGREANFTQTRITATDRIFSIPFAIGTHEIEIFVTQII